MMANKKTAFPQSVNKNIDIHLIQNDNQLQENDEIPWADEARKRVEHAPDFVRPGIYKLMQKKARLHGLKEITSGFLSEIRDESMKLASKRIKNIGLMNFVWMHGTRPKKS